jgi:glycosyltransferase involved in cell wall biosynthesis
MLSRSYGSGDVLLSPSISAGDLNGVTIMRYAHIYRDHAAGGVEQYLRELNYGLLQRHRLTLIQMHLVRDECFESVASETFGLGRLIWVPVPIRQAHSAIRDLPTRLPYLYRRAFRRHLQGGAVCRAIISSLRDVISQKRNLRYRDSILSEQLADILTMQKVDVLVLHWLSYDTGALISRAIAAKVPLIVINHFDNDHLSKPLMRRAIPHAVALGTVSRQGVPDDLWQKCVNVSDAIDSDFFSPDKALQKHQQEVAPILLLPARIEVGKGHTDLIEAASLLCERGIDLKVYFAGRVDSDVLFERLQQMASGANLQRRIIFLGEKSRCEMRDLYARSTVVVLPTHSEGLGRVLLEAQAMRKPVVAYDCGGTREAMRPNETGFLVKRGDIAALADKIQTLLDDESKRYHFGERGREFVQQHFKISTLVERHEQLYLRALASICR